MIIAITGNIGSGKTAASHIFKNHGYYILNADKIGHKLYQKKEIKRIIVKKFGDSILKKGNIDRSQLKNIVFNNKSKLRKLNNLMHPLILKEITKESKKHKKIVVEAALIIESGYKKYNKLILLTINKNIQIKRLLSKGKYTKPEILNIIKLQLSTSKMLEFADYIIDNSGTKKELKDNIEKILK